MAIARIVPVPADAGSPQRTRGTQVWVGDTQFTGVTRIELVADTDNNLWRAVIHCHVNVPELIAEADIITGQGASEV